jgi:hypothetical protein
MRWKNHVTLFDNSDAGLCGIGSSTKSMMTLAEYSQPLNDFSVDWAVNRLAIPTDLNNSRKMSLSLMVGTVSSGSSQGDVVHWMPRWETVTPTYNYQMA